VNRREEAGGSVSEDEVKMGRRENESQSKRKGNDINDEKERRRKRLRRERGEEGGGERGGELGKAIRERPARYKR